MEGETAQNGRVYVQFRFRVISINYIMPLLLTPTGQTLERQAQVSGLLIDAYKAPGCEPKCVRVFVCA